MISFEPSRENFAGLAKRAGAVPVYSSLLSDQMTPVSAFERLAGESDHAFLLESVVGGEKIARYSFLGLDPYAVVEAASEHATVQQNGNTESATGRDPLDVLREVVAARNVAHLPGLPRFLGGAVGYAGYDIVRHYEKLPSAPADDRGFPDLLFGLYDQMVVFDHVRKLTHVVVYAHLDAGDAPDAAYDKACERIRAIVQQLQDVTADAVKPFVPPGGKQTDFESNITREQFEQNVERCKDYIRAGDIFQVVISQRLSATTEASPFDVYRALRVVNPSPFMFYLKTPKVILVGASPEILCRLEGSTVSSRPLAGTRPRGRNEAEDQGLEAELLADPKERAEHVMLVDLGRNDLGRICEPGSVVIDDLMSVERYSHVMHICSNVSGVLASGKNAFDAIRAVLPVGTVSGAPKVRAMEIIDELETVRRGPYAGAVGYIDFAGNMDTCIALRTLVIAPSDSGKWRVDAQVGAGIVADSEPHKEYEETLNKAQSMLSALELAEAWKKAN